MQIKNIKIESFDYHLPESNIPHYPLAERDSSKLLVYENGKITHSRFKQLDEFLESDSLLVFNNTRVIRARLIFYKETGARIEIFCLEPIVPHEFSLSFQQTESCIWKCIVGNLKKWKHGELLMKVETPKGETTLKAERKESIGESEQIHFSWDNPELHFAEVIEHAGKTPIPPYLEREADESDTIRYQTVYSKHNGSVAAPTAGLHFTPNVFEALSEKQIKTAEVTLHVGAGTFKPVKSEEIGDHEMHTEHFYVNKSLIQELLHYEGRVTAVGTTTVRTLESLYWLGVKAATKIGSDCHISQWEAYDLPQDISPETALNALLAKAETELLSCSTQIIIAPGYKLRMVNQLVTNFHQPKSTLLLLISTFIGEDWRRVYSEALANEYRFLSYGDSSLLKA